MTFLEAVRKAGRWGSITRWSDQKVLIVQRFDFNTGAAVIWEATENGSGNWAPDEADLRAADWMVVAHSVWRFPTCNPQGV